MRGCSPKARSACCQGNFRHRDFGDAYTGLLTAYHALAFAIGGHSLLTLRIALLLAFALWVPGHLRDRDAVPWDVGRGDRHVRGRRVERAELLRLDAIVVQPVSGDGSGVGRVAVHGPPDAAPVARRRGLLRWAFGPS